MHPIDIVRPTTLIEFTIGSREIVIGLSDGPAAPNLPDLAGDNVPLSAVPAQFLVDHDA
jgi:hypothetical protein